MLNENDNTLLTRIEGDAPMGRMIREQYWIPALRAGQLVADGAPIPVRLFGVNYVAFRATDGQVGFLDDKCPHRGVSMTLARNEDCSLRCIFHGVKIHVSGKVLEVPTQFGNQEGFIKTLKVRHFPVREAGGLVWVWLGADKTPAPFPDLEFMSLDENQIDVQIQEVKCNWFQGIEGAIDSSHVGILHKTWLDDLGGQSNLNAKNTAPRYEFEITPYGFKAAAVRSISDDQNYIRTTEFVFPFYGFIPPYDKDSGDRLTVVTVPIDNENFKQIYLRYNLKKAVRVPPVREGFSRDAFAPVVGDRSTAWGQDRASMKAGNYSGFDILQLEDFAVMVSMGRIADRSDEQLFVSDTLIVQARRLFLKAIRDFEAGLPTPGVTSKVKLEGVRSYSLLADASAKWNSPELVKAAA